MLSKNQFVRSHGLGNDYIVMDPAHLSFELTPQNIIRICNRNTGVGSDGILALEKSDSSLARLRIYNPDGSEAEKSGNGLRIFCKFLFEHGYTEKTFFEIETAGGKVQAQLHLVVGKAAAVTVEMGKAVFTAGKIPVNVPNPDSEVLDKLIPLDNKGDGFNINCVSMGNPHCVIFVNDLDHLGRNPSSFPKTHQRAVCGGRQSQGSQYPDLGTRRGLHPRFRLLLLCRGRGMRQNWKNGPRSDHPHARR
jgi:diaminopimelate epimerase